MSKINFQPIFDHIDSSISSLKKEILDDLRSEFRGDFKEILTTLGNIAGQLDNLTKEIQVSNYRTKRLEDWAEPVGKKVGIPIEF